MRRPGAEKSRTPAPGTEEHRAEFGPFRRRQQRRLQIDLGRVAVHALFHSRRQVPQGTDRSDADGEIDATPIGRIAVEAWRMLRPDHDLRTVDVPYDQVVNIKDQPHRQGVRVATITAVSAGLTMLAAGALYMAALCANEGC